MTTISISPYLAFVVLAAYGSTGEEIRSCSYYGRPPKSKPGERWMKAALREVYQRCNRQNYTGPTGCCNGKPLGMKDGSIPTSSITELRGSNYGKSYARLGTRHGWCYFQSQGANWIQVDLGATRDVTGLITKGFAGCWVVEYQVTYGFDGDNWRNVTDGELNDDPRKFTGNTDTASLVTAQFPVAVRTRYLRIEPARCNNNICCLKFEVLGCSSI